MDIGLQEPDPVEVPEVEGEDVPVLLAQLLPQLVHVVMAPLPTVGGEWLKSLLRLLHQGGDFDKEGLATHQPVDKVHQMRGAIVEPKLQIKEWSVNSTRGFDICDCPTTNFYIGGFLNQPRLLT